MASRNLLLANIFLVFFFLDILLKFFVIYYRDVEEVRNFFLISFRYLK